MIWSTLWPFVLFAVGVVVVIWATERLLEGLAAARREAAELALGTVFGGAIFLVCVALGLGALLYPLRVTLPRGFLILMAFCPVLVGLGLIGGSTSRLAGVVLLVAFVAAIVYLVHASRDHAFLESEEVKEAEEEPRSYTAAIGLTIAGLVVIALGGELVTRGAEGIVSVLGLSTLLVGMVVTPAAIEIEEVIRQAVPAREGRPEVSAGNLV